MFKQGAKIKSTPILFRKFSSFDRRKAVLVKLFDQGTVNEIFDVNI